MNATFDTLALSQALEAAGFKRTMAEGAASAIQEIAMRDVATTADVRDAVHSLTVRVGVIVVAAVTIAVAILGAIISISLHP